MASVAASPPNPKEQLRETLKTRRAAMSQDHRGEADQAINQRLLRWLNRAGAQDVSFYVPLSGEADVRPAVFEWIDQGGQTCLPCVEADDKPLRFAIWAPGDPLTAGPFGTQEPLPEAPSVVPDLLIIPLVGFDEQGARLGWGGGFYDRTLSYLRRTAAVTAVGIGYDLQEADILFADPWDQKLDVIVTETRTIEVSS